MTNTPAGDGVPANELPANGSLANGTLANGISPAAPGPYAIAEASGQQFWLQPNRYYDLDRIHAEVDAIVTLDQILLVRDSSGTRLGLPHVPEATVTLKVIAHRRGPKILVYKMRPKKKTRRKNGHRQELTRVMVESITVGGQPLS